MQEHFSELDPRDVCTRFFRNLSSLTLTRQMAECPCSDSYADTGPAEVANPVRPDFHGQRPGAPQITLLARALELELLVDETTVSDHTTGNIPRIEV